MSPKGQKGLVYLLNNLGSWNGATVQTQWVDGSFTPLAWRGHDNVDVPEAKQTDGEGNGISGCIWSSAADIFRLLCPDRRQGR
jgi:hypothetical protein